uniref:Secreted protein n=1 Tax=Vitrella brassicaformis TaxID=1169539 RepID=A0A7S1PCI2_9ALVE|mmetsp:Transcript_52468/g.131876  ORF Transcript_52468/g.131876 Transcript_52468/m.131876 type:complete len:157 (+) Transcript_52468:1193-1663(+)
MRKVIQRGLFAASRRQWRVSSRRMHSFLSLLSVFSAHVCASSLLPPLNDRQLQNWTQTSHTTPTQYGEWDERTQRNSSREQKWQRVNIWMDGWVRLSCGRGGMAWHVCAQGACGTKKSHGHDPRQAGRQAIGRGVGEESIAGWYQTQHKTTDNETR